MWQDRPSPTRLSAIEGRLRAVLPPPAPGAQARETPLDGAVPPERVAAMLAEQPGFSWLDAQPGVERLFPKPLAVLSATRGAAVASGPFGRTVFAAKGFDLLAGALAAWGPAPGALLVGFLGYELAAEVEELPVNPRDFATPDLWLGLYDSRLTWDGGWKLSGTTAWRRCDPVRAEKLLAAAQAAVPPRLPRRPLTAGPLRSRPARDGFAQAVARTVRRIHNGDLFQTNLCRRMEAPLDPSAILPLYLRMRRRNPARYGAFLRMAPDQAVLSMSPELFLQAAGGNVASQPIKGTRPRGRNRREDAALAADLTASEKDRAELAMIVDVVRNDLGRVCAPGSVRVDAFADLLTLPTVHHTSATVTGRLDPESGAVDLLRAAFPPASVTGAPKIQAIKVAAGEECRGRGPAMGAIGWIALDGDLELAVAIRTAVASGGRIFYNVGAGITADSDPGQEAEETGVKALAFVRSLGLDSGQVY